MTRREFFSTVGSAGAAAAAWAAVAGSSSAAAGGGDRKADGEASRARVYGQVRARESGCGRRYSSSKCESAVSIFEE